MAPTAPIYIAGNPWRSRPPLHAGARGRHALLGGMALMLGLVGPLLCVVHCAVWPDLLPSDTAAHTGHQHVTAPLAGPTLAAPLAATSAHCAMMMDGGAPGPLPTVPIPPPFYALLAVAGLLLALPLGSRLWPRQVAHAPPSPPHPPPLRPPILALV